MNTRANMLKVLLSLSKPIEEITKALSELDWDSDELVVIEMEHIKRILERYLSGELNEAAIETWANTVEYREDIGLSEKNEGVVKELIHELANPDLTQRLTPERARALIMKS